MKIVQTLLFVFSVIIAALVISLYGWFLLDTQQEVFMWMPLSVHKPQNIVVFTWGTRGDIEPFIGLGQKLKGAGKNHFLTKQQVLRAF